MKEGEAKKYGCTYCNLSNICENYKEDNAECEHFVLGRCFNCTIYKNNKNKKNYAYCIEPFDYCGCDNYMNLKGED